MKINQISVFMENKEGRLYNLCNLLGKHKINIHALIIAESEGFGVARIIVDKPNDAIKALKAEGLTVSLTDIVAVEVPDTPGGLSDILKILHDNKVNVEYMYGFGEKLSDRALMIFRFDDTNKATELLQANNVNIVKSEEIQKN